MNREEMVEWMISKEPGNPKLQKFTNRKLYSNDNQKVIDLLMALQSELEGKIRGEIADSVRDLAHHWSSSDVADVAEFIRTGTDNGKALNHG